MIRSHHASIRGFTLIEVMVVIVIMSIMASLVVLNIGGVDQRKAMQTREVLLLDLQRILREARLGANAAQRQEQDEPAEREVS